jgi:uncharacterized membrane protein/thiol-disulfide isomerase/thioredoxin
MKRLCLILGLVWLLIPRGIPGQTPEPVVHAVLFFSPTCPHCHQVIEELLIPLQDQYGRRLVLMGMDITQEWANGLYWEAIRHYEIPEADWAVPFLVVGEEVLVGADSIPSRFPGIIEEGLASGGIDLPSYPALVTFLREANLLDPRYPDRLIALTDASDQSETEPAAEDSAGADPGQTAADTGSVVDSASAVDPAPAVDSASAVDPAEMVESVPPFDSTAVAESTVVVDSTRLGASTGDDTPTESPEMLVDERQDTAATPPALDSTPETVGPLRSLDLAEAAREMESMTMWDRFTMDKAGNSLSVLVLLFMLFSLALRSYPPRVRGGDWPSWVIPTLVVVGAGVAAYLSFIEITQTEAVCGPVGDCNTVNQSRYALLLGFLPVGILGLVGYGLMLGLWVIRRTGPGGSPRLATLGLWAASLFGTLFSVYLTFLEPFVIGATCAWCLTSAVVMTLLLWATSPLAARAWQADETSPGTS